MFSDEFGLKSVTSVSVILKAQNVTYCPNVMESIKFDIFIQNWQKLLLVYLDWAWNAIEYK